MESPTEAAAAGPPPPTFSQVVFTDIPYSYPPSTSITCSYTITAALQPNPRDWVGIFKVGWSSTKDYHTFVWVEPCLDVVGQQSLTRQAVFKDYYLPKDEVEFYQFCYIDNSGQVRGASTPFCFRDPESQSMESSQEDDLLVITTQEQVDQSVREKAELQRELNQIMEEKETLKSALQKEQQEAVSMKAQNEEKEKEKLQLIKELDQIKQQNESLKSAAEQQQRETDRLKEERLVQKTKQMELEQHSPAELKTLSQSCSFDTTTRQSEKYEQAVMKINQLKEVRKELQGTVDAQSEEITKLNSLLREQERELFKMKDCFQLMQVDLQSSEKEKESLQAELQKLQSLADNMDDMKRENRELSRRLSEQETVQNCPDDDLRTQCQTLTTKLQDAQGKLAAEKEESRKNKRQMEFLGTELTHIRTELDCVIQSYEQEQRKSSKLELQLREAHEAIAEKDSTLEDQEGVIRLMRHEKEELVRENETLNGDMEELRRVYADFHAGASADTPQMQPDTGAPASTTSTTQEQQQQQEEAGEAENIYENLFDTIGGDPQPGEETLVCRHCQESFPFITRHELELHEQSHRVCPFCTMICDNMEQSVFEDHVYGHEL